MLAVYSYEKKLLFFIYIFFLHLLEHFFKLYLRERIISNPRMFIKMCCPCPTMVSVFEQQKTNYSGTIFGKFTNVERRGFKFQSLCAASFFMSKEVCQCQR